MTGRAFDLTLADLGRRALRYRPAVVTAAVVLGFLVVYPLSLIHI